MLVMFIGPPGSGKNVHSSYVAKVFGYLRIVASDLVKDVAADASNPFSALAQAALASGDLIPDDQMCDLVANRTAQPDCNPEEIVFDGFIRTEGQARKWWNDVGSKLKERPRVICLELDDATALARMQKRAETENRVDNPPAVQMHRLEVFRNVTLPGVLFLEQQGVVYRIDASGDIATTQLLILAALS